MIRQSVTHTYVCMYASDVMHIWLLVKPYYSKCSPVLFICICVVGLDELLLYTIYIILYIIVCICRIESIVRVATTVCI